MKIAGHFLSVETLHMAFPECLLSPGKMPCLVKPREKIGFYSDLRLSWLAEPWQQGVEFLFSHCCVSSYRRVKIDYNLSFVALMLVALRIYRTMSFQAQEFLFQVLIRFCCLNVFFSFLILLIDLDKEVTHVVCSLKK